MIDRCELDLLVSDNGSYVAWNRFVCILSVVSPRAVPFIVEETAPFTGELNMPNVTPGPPLAPSRPTSGFSVLVSATNSSPKSR
jgi:hypothetical protein